MNEDQLRERVKALEAALAGIKWQSADRDNMEFTARITCYQMDVIRAALLSQPPVTGEG